jgi:hypothetical protein
MILEYLEKFIRNLVLTALFGNEGKPYSYSNITMQPSMEFAVAKLKPNIEAVAETTLQLYYLINIATGKTAMAC